MRKFARLYGVNQFFLSYLSLTIFQMCNISLHFPIMCNKFLHFLAKKLCFVNDKHYQITANRLRISKKTRSFLIKYLSPLLVEGRTNSPGI